jgi:hypothetical protein
VPLRGQDLSRNDGPQEEDPGQQGEPLQGAAPETHRGGAQEGGQGGEAEGGVAEELHWQDPAWRQDPGGAATRLALHMLACLYHCRQDVICSILLTNELSDGLSCVGR